MKATLIDFKKKVIDIAEMRRMLKIKEIDKSSVPFDIRGPEVAQYNFFGGVDKAYDLIELHSVNKAGVKMTQRFFVNQEDIEIVFPIINAMVRNRTKNLEEEARFAEISYSIVKKKYDKLKSYWFNRVIEWLLEKTEVKK